MTKRKYRLEYILDELYKQAANNRGKAFSRSLPNGLTVGAKIMPLGETTFYIFRKKVFPGSVEWDTVLSRWAGAGPTLEMGLEKIPVTIKEIGDKKYMFIKYYRHTTRGVDDLIGDGEDSPGASPGGKE